MMFNPDNKNKVPEDQNIIEFLILNGALETAGVDAETGEMLYSFTEKIKDIMPHLYHEHMSHVNKEIMRLWEKGYINIDLLSDKDPNISLSSKAFDLKALEKLDKADRWALEEIKRVSRYKEF